MTEHRCEYPDAAPDYPRTKVRALKLTVAALADAWDGTADFQQAAEAMAYETDDCAWCLRLLVLNLVGYLGRALVTDRRPQLVLAELELQLATALDQIGG